METQNQPSMGMTQAPRDNYGASIITLTNPLSLVYNIELSLRNLQEDADGNLIKMGNPLMNDTGVSAVLAEIKAVINQNTVMSNLDAKEVKGFSKELIYTLSKMLMVNTKEFEIVNKHDRDRIIDICILSCYICMKRPFNEGERDFWGRQKSISEIRHSEENQGGFFRKMGSFRRRE